MEIRTTLVSIVCALTFMSTSAAAQNENYKVISPKARYQLNSSSAANSASKSVTSNPNFWRNIPPQAVRPLPMPAVKVINKTSGTQGDASQLGSPSTTRGKPILIPGWDPRKPQSSKKPTRKQLQLDGTYATGAQTQAYQYGTGPASATDYSAYGKFQRNVLQGKYLVYPRSIVGKLFFSDGVSTYVCSATVVGRSMIFTAGHCVSDGSGSFYTNFLFCPSFKEDSSTPLGNPSVGCWAVNYVATTPDWHLWQSVDRDYACLVTNSTGTVKPNYIGDITGWGGIAFNYPSMEMVWAMGYPAATPFAGKTIVTVQGPEWYTYDNDPTDYSPNVVSKYMGNDMTGGSSGGPWFLNWDIGNPIADTDGSSVTDPLAGELGPYIVGVNSHKRINGSVYTQEMGSAIFTTDSTAPAGNAFDAEDVYNLCASNGG